MRTRLLAYLLISMAVLNVGAASIFGAEERPIDVIEDNSFLIEEAYNQEPGVVQHIFNAAYTTTRGRHGWGFSFTQEWPVFSLEHQLSYTIPSYHLIDGTDRVYGIGDILINYRYQALEEGEVKPAFAPRLSLILPTGNRDRGTGNGVVGYQWSLPFSKKLASRFAMHANFGLTYLPHVQARLDGSIGPLSPKSSLVSYNVGSSAIFAILPRLHFMLEWVGNFDQSLNDDGKRERSFRSTLSPGFRAAIVNEEKLQIVAGVAAPIGLNRRTDNIGTFLYFSVEHDFIPK